MRICRIGILGDRKDDFEIRIILIPAISRRFLERLDLNLYMATITDALGSWFPGVLPVSTSTYL